MSFKGKGDRGGLTILLERRAEFSRFDSGLFVAAQQGR